MVINLIAFQDNNRAEIRDLKIVKCQKLRYRKHRIIHSTDIRSCIPSMLLSKRRYMSYADVSIPTRITNIMLSDN